MGQADGVAVSLASAAVIGLMLLGEMVSSGIWGSVDAVQFLVKEREKDNYNKKKHKKKGGPKP